jgi:pimeloyl-ACP methyl ester carboxylesterase
MATFLLLGILSFATVPLLIPFQTSGTLSNRQAAGSKVSFAELGGVSVAYQEMPYSGTCKCKAPLIILLHGFGASTFSWREVEKPFTRFGQVIAYDRPGFGFSERPSKWGDVNPYSFAGNFRILDDLITKFGAGRRVVLVGHSAGGQLAAEYARLHPASVSSLILVDPAILTTGTAPSWLQWFYDIPQIARLGPILVSTIASSGDELIYKSFYDKSKVTKGVLEGYHKPLKVAGWEQGFWNFVTAPRENQLVANLDQIKQPILLITGAADTVVPTAETRKLLTLVQNGALEVIPRTGHLPHEERPEAFMAAVTKHWLNLVGN